jgi:hypothetical protein
LEVVNCVVLPGSMFYTDEEKIYRSLGSSGAYEHKSVVQKYQFVDYDTNVHTQNVESYNNIIKMRIKNMKDVREECRAAFSREFLWLDLWKEQGFEKTLELLKY